MADLKMRPRFAVDVACGADVVVDALSERIARSDPRLEGFFDRRHCVLRIPAERRTLWSPELDLTFERRADARETADGVRIRCMFAPRPAVWTAFAYTYAFIALLGLCGGLYGLAQLSIGWTPWALWMPLAAAALIGAIYAVTFIGQGLAATQMYELRRYLDEGVELAEARARATPRTPLDSAQL